MYRGSGGNWWTQPKMGTTQQCTGEVKATQLKKGLGVVKHKINDV